MTTIRTSLRKNHFMTNREINSSIIFIVVVILIFVVVRDFCFCGYIEFCCSGVFCCGDTDICCFCGEGLRHHHGPRLHLRGDQGEVQSRRG